MKKGFFQTLSAMMALLCFFQAQSAELLSMNFFQEGEVSKLELTLDNKDVKFNKTHLAEDKQIILDFADLKAAEKVVRAFDTSEFSGSVVFVNAYPKPSSEKDLRLVLQLRENVRSVVSQTDNKVVLSVENRFGVFSEQKAKTGAAASPENYKKELESGSMSYQVPKSDSVEDILENLTLSGRKKYIGKRISINVKEVGYEDVLRMIATTSGFNIILHEEVKKLPPVTLSLNSIPWDQALDTILELGALVAKKNGNILIVTTLDEATKEKQLELRASQAAQRQEPLVTKIFPISFANLRDMMAILREYITLERGKISQDERTNSLIVQDTVTVIERMKKIVEALDTQTPQVLIEAKIVEIDESLDREFGLDKGLIFGYDPIEPIKPAEGPGFAFNSAVSPNDVTGGGLMGLTIGRYGRLFDLSMNLRLMEHEKKGRIVSTPKIITQNKMAASISSSEMFYYPENNQTATGITLQTYKDASASLKLTVTPQITNEGSIVMQVDLSKEDFGPPTAGGTPRDVSTRDVKTNVLVDNGSTIVIGGIYKFVHRESSRGIPFLKDIPLVGWLFREAEKPESKKNELVIFLTPRIINQEEAGLVQKGNL